MSYWRMQLHDLGYKRQAIKYCVESLAAGYIGLDFHKDTGDLSVIKKDSPNYKGLLPGSEGRCWVFAHEMKKDDIVLIMAHNRPFSLVEVIGEYNYIKHTDSDSPAKFWFRHFRAVKVLDYYADYIYDTNYIHDTKENNTLIMADTIVKVDNTKTEFYKFIVEWLDAIQKK
jgi:hypothetical protein